MHKFLSLHAFPVVFAVALWGSFYVFSNGDPQAAKDFFLYYGDLAKAFLPRLLYHSFVFLVLSLSTFLAFQFFSFGVLRQKDPRDFLAAALSRQTLRSLAGKLPLYLALVLPLLLGSIVLSFAVGQLNLLNAASLKDGVLFQLDLFLTGTFPPLVLGTIAWPSWFVWLVREAFAGLGPVLVLFAAYLLWKRPRLFHQSVSAFFIATSIMFFGWLLLPALSPYDRYINNAYEEPVQKEAQVFADSYAPHPGVAEFWKETNQKREGLAVLPTTAFPSAHVAWTLLAVYYAALAHRLLLAAALPFALLSIFGTVLFAAHYFADIPAGLAAALVSIAGAAWLEKQDGQRKQHGYNGGI